MTIAICQTLERICATAGADLYRARRTTDGMPVLLKRSPEPAEAAQSARLKREYLLLQSLNVAGVAKPLALVKEGGGLALVLEDFAGESLEAVLDREPRMDVALCLRIGRHLADALAGIDRAKVIHRDIRPANILVAPVTGQVLLVDFTLTTAHETNTVSPEGVVVPVGDWAYVSPEQTGRMNRQVDYRTAFYSMGVLLYRMLSGQLPFEANDPLEWTHCHIARMPAPPHEIVPEVPQAVSDIVMKLLAKLPEDRYQSAYGLRADLDRCLAQWQASGRIEAFPLGTEDIPERFQVPHRLYGRGPEVERLLGVFERMVASGQTALATVSGYAGIGKSALVDALRKPIVAKHGYFISGKFDQYQRDIPYATLTQAFRELVRQLLAESETHIAGWRQRIQAAVGVNGQLIVDVLPQVEIIIGPQPPVAALPPSEAQNRFRMVLRQFVTVFASEAHPLVVFLDDLQWTDAASLTFIEDLITHPDTRYLLLIGAYRDNEVDASHPLVTTLETIRHSGAPVTDLKLAPLSVVQLNQLVADTLHASPVVCEPLTRLVYERTEGNPFFFIQFLDSLNKEGLLRHDMRHWAWQWDLDQIKAKDFADNVVDLVIGKLRQLSAPAQEALQLAACLGNTFELRHLALVSRKSATETGQCLAAAVRERLLLRTHGSGKFLHDRIQQAAYSLIPASQHAVVHLRIGRVLLASLTADELTEHLFDVANQFNRGATLLDDRDEKAQVATLDLRAGRKAKASAAYASACVYLAAGIALLDEKDWGNRYELMFSLRLASAECEFLTGDFEQAERLIAELLQRRASKFDRAAVYHLKVLLHVMKSENSQAVDSARACAMLFGIDIPAHPTWEQVQAEYGTVRRSLEGRPIEALIDLPLMTDPEMRTAMEVLSIPLEAAYFTDLNVFCLLLCCMVNVSLRQGTSGPIAQAYNWLGTILGPVFHSYSEGDRFIQLASDLVEKHGFIAFRAKEGFAHDLAAGFDRARESTTAARTHLDEVHSSFMLWGTGGEVRQLDERTPPRHEQPASPSVTSPSNVGQLDLLSVAKASQAISCQIVLEDLIDTLMHILLENAGAQTGQLLLVRNESLVLAAEASVEQQTIHVRRLLNQTPSASAPPGSAAPEAALPSSIVNYVRRCQERVLLDDARQSNPFSADDYLSRRQPKSVLCLPLMRRSELIGLLYVENNLATHAFTPERVTVLELLASQAAISLENAMLYAALREREARIRRLVDSNIIGIFFGDLVGNASEANDAFLQIVGYTRQDLLSGNINWTGMTPPEYRAADARHVEELRRTGTCQPFEKEYIRKDGRRVPVMVGSAILEGSQEQGLAFVLDLTERKRAEEQLQALQAQLTHATRAKTVEELSASVAHEVGQPLTAIVTSGEACLRWLGHRTPQPEEVRACVEHMIAEGRRAGEIVQGIRSLTRRANPQKTRLELNDVVNDVVSLVQREVVNHRVSLRLELAPELPPLLGDRVQLQQVIINFVMNGIQAMADIGDAPRELLIESRRDNGGHVVVAVRDFGTGIDPENADRLFDAFFTTKPDGMGMGLSICRSIIEAHGGRVWASSNAGRGAVFQFSLPAIGENGSN
ncbi:trifunctional serine/threonine-protein kinase/ATP-binding protein/sensor histidine kinase [Paraburkholderia sp. RL17-337-BIB-A]|uniref:trifunctional serine/threonine-protein kinase/ATP-binding protein/sensor histidine kinase n=1 Tax=Paraburkholderia sp. RL17-337-BIB-A TaxID=3031636 RepID=UPI0038B7A238